MRSRTGQTVAGLGEFELIESLLEALGDLPETLGAGGRVLLSAGDDTCAVQPTPGTVQLVTTDTMVRGIHFLPELSPRDLGWKSMASNISDVASMGGAPTFALVTLAMPGSTEVEWLREWYIGMAECALQYGVAILGGDIVRTFHDLAITLSLAGEAEPGKVVPRSGARVGDRLLVTGTLGDSAAGLALLQAGLTPPDRLRSAHVRPLPRVREAALAVSTGEIHAMMDLSDGLGGDLRRLTGASGIGALIFATQIPLSRELEDAAAKLGRDPLEFAVSGGEDYELLLATTPEAAKRLTSADGQAKLARFREIGEIVHAEEGVQLQPGEGDRKPLAGSFTHF